MEQTVRPVSLRFWYDVSGNIKERLKKNLNPKGALNAGRPARTAAVCGTLLWTAQAEGGLERPWSHLWGGTKPGSPDGGK